MRTVLERGACKRSRCDSSLGVGIRQQNVPHDGVQIVAHRYELPQTAPGGRKRVTAEGSRLSQSKIQFQGKLGDTRRRGEVDGAKSSCGRHMGRRTRAARKQTLARKVAEPAGCYELGVIPDVKQLGTELQNETLVELSVLEDGEIPIVDAGSVEEAPVRGAF